MSFPSALQQQLKGKKLQCLGHKSFFLKTCHVAGKCSEKKRELGSLERLPHYHF